MSEPHGQLSRLQAIASSSARTITQAFHLQDPAQADKLTKIQKDLDETKVILHQTIDSMLQRGEKLDDLVGKSHDLSMASQIFYKQVGLLQCRVYTIDCLAGLMMS